MTRKHHLIVLLLVLVVGVSGCSAGSSQVEATVEAAVAQTQQIAAMQQGDEIAAAVAATDVAQEAMQTTIEAAVAATVAAMPTPTPVQVEELSEEEMVDTVETSNEEAIEASQQAVVYAEEAAEDGELSEEEVQTIALYVAIAEEEIEQAEELVDLYLSVYAELAEETIDLLYAVEEDLSIMAQSATELNDVLVAIEQDIENGQQIAVDVITQLQTQSEEFQHNIDQIKNQSSEWVQAVRNEIQSRPDRYLNVEADQIFTERKEIIEQVRSYVDEVQFSLQDGVITRLEMDSIALLGANANASLNGFSGNDRLDASRFQESINTVTSQLSRGELPQARTGVDSLQRSIPRR